MQHVCSYAVVVQGVRDQGSAFASTQKVNLTNWKTLQSPKLRDAICQMLFCSSRLSVSMISLDLTSLKNHQGYSPIDLIIHIFFFYFSPSSFA